MQAVKCPVCTAGGKPVAGDSLGPQYPYWPPYVTLGTSTTPPPPNDWLVYQQAEMAAIDTH